jgi:osmotically-inducible protein OsmY
MRLRQIGLALAGATVLVAIFFATHNPENVVIAMAFSSALGVGNPNAANAKLEETVKAALATDEELRQAELQVQADVTRNQVTLSGTVESEAARARAVELAKKAQVGVKVQDNITIRK